MNEDYSKKLNCFFRGGLFGIIIMLILYTAVAVVLTFRDLNNGTLNFLSLIICGAGGFCAAAKIGRENKRDGIKIGGIMGGTIFVIVTIVGMILGGSFSLLTLLRFIITVCCSVAGGIFGVNGSGKRKMK